MIQNEKNPFIIFSKHSFKEMIKNKAHNAEIPCALFYMQKSFKALLVQCVGVKSILPSAFISVTGKTLGQF